MRPLFHACFLTFCLLLTKETLTSCQRLTPSIMTFCLSACNESVYRSFLFIMFAVDLVGLIERFRLLPLLFADVTEVYGSIAPLMCTSTHRYASTPYPAGCDPTGFSWIRIKQMSIDATLVDVCSSLFAVVPTTSAHQSLVLFVASGSKSILTCRWLLQYSVFADNITVHTVRD